MLLQFVMKIDEMKGTFSTVIPDRSKTRMMLKKEKRMKNGKKAMKMNKFV